MSVYKLSFLLFIALFLASPATANDAFQTDQLIIKYKTNSHSARLSRTIQARSVDNVLQSTGLRTRYKRAMAASTSSHVLKLPYAMSVEEANNYAKQIMVGNPDVEFAEADRKRYPKLIPNDPYQSQQWSIKGPDNFAGAANLYSAWDIATGDDITIAILDSGYQPHRDLTANIVGEYDFVATLNNGDGDGRDPDASDPGSVTTDEPAFWHGTHVAGVAAARGNNQKGITGTAYRSSLLMVRILGNRGGFLSDQVDAMLWAAGESVRDVPDNPNPASIINLSIGSDSIENCSRLEQETISFLYQKGVITVVSAGNENRDVAGAAPANCLGVITATAVMRDGARAFFSNYGANNDIAAPGYQILSTSNAGTDTPITSASGDNYTYLTGTSMVAPRVSGVISLMLSANQNLTNGSTPPSAVPEIIETKLKQSARPFPTRINGSSRAYNCELNSQQNCVCTTETCGAGLLDGYQAVVAIATPPTAEAGTTQNVIANHPVILNASGSRDDAFNIGPNGKPILSYNWKQVSGPVVQMQRSTTVNPQFVSPTVDAVTILEFELIVSDDTYLESTPKTVEITVNPQSSRQINTDKVQQVFIAYYGRPADTAGLDYWADQLEANGGELATIINQFGNSDEYTNRFAGANPQDLVNNLYQSLFNRDADAAGLEYYTNQLANGAISLADIALLVLEGATGVDKLIISNKLSVVRYFDKSIRDTDKDYTATDIPILNSILASVDLLPITLADAKTAIDVWMLGPLAEAREDLD